MATTKGKIAASPGTEARTGPWDEALHTLREWDPQWAEAFFNVSTNPWTNGIRPRKTVELISLAVNAASTKPRPRWDAPAHPRDVGRGRHSRRDIDSPENGIPPGDSFLQSGCSHSPGGGKSGGPATSQTSKNASPTPAVDKVRAIGQWNQAWDPFYDLDPVWTDKFMATGIGIYAGAVIEPKVVEFLSIAFDASYTHLYAPGTRRHIKAALTLGATLEEVMEVLKLCVVQGVQACNVGISILAEELAVRENGKAKSAV